MGLTELLILTAGLAVAGLAKGMAGMGLPLIATPILAGVESAGGRPNSWLNAGRNRSRR